MALIIVEGCDGAGKTTLINRLASDLNLPIVKSFKPRLRADVDQFDNWANACPRTPITDRHAAISDLIYGPIIRGYTPATLEGAKARVSNNFLIYCAPPFEQLEKNAQVEVQMEGVLPKLRAIYDGYEKLMDQLEPHHIYDYTQKKSYSVLARQLTHFLERTR